MHTTKLHRSTIKISCGNIEIAESVGDHDVDTFINQINNPHINSITIYSCGFSAVAAAKIANALCENDNITIVDIGFYMNPQIIIAIVVPLLNKNKLHELRILNTFFTTNEDIIEICDAVQNAFNLKVFEICIDHYLHDAVEYLTRTMATNTTLSHLGIMCRRGIAPYVVYLLNNNEHLIHLNLSRCNIDDDGAKMIADALKLNKTLQILDLTRNLISHEGAIAIGESLKTNDTLTVLKLDNGIISPDNRTEIVDVFEKNYSLMNLTIYKTTDIFPNITDRNRELTAKRRFITVKVAV